MCEEEIEDATKSRPTRVINKMPEFTDEQIEDIISGAASGHLMAGFDITEKDRAMGRAYLRGDISRKDAIAAIKAGKDVLKTCVASGDVSELPAAPPVPKYEPRPHQLAP